MNPIVPEVQAAKPAVPKDPADRYSIFTKIWIGIAVATTVTEVIALQQDKRNPDRVKRTLSSNTRTLFAWDSITGRPLEVRYGRLRRTAFICLMAWLPQHIQQLGRHHGLKV